MSTTNQYEATFILGEDTTPEQAQAKTASVTEAIKGLGGSVSKHELWGKRELAYLIKRNRAGFYVTLWFDLPSKEVAALEKLLRFDESVLRSLVTLAYTTAQPGSLYPVTEEEKQEKPARGTKRTQETEEPTGAEAELRRTTSTRAPKKAAKTAEEAPEVSEEERMQKLDEALGDILKDEA
jgi:small subunit ribosomal protein S6